MKYKMNNHYLSSNSPTKSVVSNKNVSFFYLRERIQFIAFVISIFFSFIGTPFSASAANFTTDEFGTSITMTGEITSGDAERLATIFMSVKPIENYLPYPNLLYLNSPGGDVLEAMRIAELVKSLGITVATIGEGKGVCASSCFLIYVAALEREASGIDTLRKKGTNGNLSPIGIHRPFFRELTEGPSGAKRQEQVMAEMRAYLVGAGVGHALIDKMMSHASNDIYWLNAEDIRALGTFSPGLEEQLIAKCGYNAKRESNLSAREYIRSNHSGAIGCIRDYMIKTYKPLLNTNVDRMRKGWRPWKQSVARP